MNFYTAHPFQSNVLKPIVSLEVTTQCVVVLLYQIHSICIYYIINNLKFDF